MILMHIYPRYTEPYQGFLDSPCSDGSPGRCVTLLFSPQQSYGDQTVRHSTVKLIGGLNCHYSTDTLINRLIVYAVQNGLITS